MTDNENLFRALAMLDDSELDALEGLDAEVMGDNEIDVHEADMVAPVDEHQLKRVQLLARAVGRSPRDVLDELLGYAIRAHDVALDESSGEDTGDIETDGGTDMIVADDDHAEILD